MDTIINGSWVVIGVLIAFGIGTLLHSVYSWYTSGEMFIARKFIASTVDALQVAILQGIAVAQVETQVEMTVGLFLVLMFNCFLAGAGVVAISSKVKKNSNAAPETDEPIPEE